MADFRVTFHGVAVERNTIDAETLGGSLLALAELVQQSAAVLEGTPKSRYLVSVTSTNSGSFEVSLALEWWDRFASLIANDDGWTAAAILWTLFGPDGLQSALIWLRGRKPDAIEEQKDQSIIRVGDEEKSFAVGAGRLSVNYGVRRHFRHLVGPIDGDQIAELAMSIDGHTTSIDRDAASALSAPLEDQLITDETAERLLRIETVHMRSRTWAFRDAYTREYLYAEILDEAFLARFDAGQEAIRKGDTLHVRLRLQQWEEDTGQTTRHTIIEVLRHIVDAGDQMSLNVLVPPELSSPPAEEE